jgi:PAS domain S-box-containing protein
MNNNDNNEKEKNKCNKVLLSIYNNIKQGVCLHELVYKKNKPVDYKIIATNPAYEKILGISSDKAKGSLGSELYGINEAPYLESYAQVAETGKSITIEEYFPPLNKHFNITVTSPEKGKFITLFEDITKRRDTKDRLKKTKERLELAMDAGEHGFWDWNLDTDEVYFSPQYYKMLGYEPGELPMTEEIWVNLLHPEDRKEVVPRIKKYIEKGQPFAEEFRLKCKDGSWKWISGM